MAIPGIQTIHFQYSLAIPNLRASSLEPFDTVNILLVIAHPEAASLNG